LEVPPTDRPHPGLSDDGQRLRFARVKNDELAHQRKQRDCSDLDNAVLALEHLRDRMVELERDQNGQDHAEESLKDLLVSRIDKSIEQQQDDPKTQLEQRGSDYDGNNGAGLRR
jgi:hypothetical protein